MAETRDDSSVNIIRLGTRPKEVVLTAELPADNALKRGYDEAYPEALRTYRTLVAQFSEELYRVAQGLEPSLKKVPSARSFEEANKRILAFSAKKRRRDVAVGVGGAVIGVAASLICAGVLGSDNASRVLLVFLGGVFGPVGAILMTWGFVK